MSDSSQSTRIIIEEASATGLKEGLIAAIIITGGVTLVLLLGLSTPDGGSGIKLLPGFGREETMISRLRQGLIDDPLLTTLSQSASSPSQSGLITGREPGNSGLGPDQDDEEDGAKSEFCPGYNKAVPYRPFYHDFKVTIPPRWCISFGYGSTWGSINSNRDWYFYTKRKAGLRPKDIAGQFAQISSLSSLNDLYFCGPLYLCGTHYEYYDSLDAAESSNLPDVDISQTGYNGLDPRHSYHLRLLVRENVGSLADFHRWATERAKGAGYYLNRRETNSAALQALKVAPERTPADAPQVKPWQPKGADRQAALVFDLYVPCIPPEDNPAESDPNRGGKATAEYYLDDGADDWMARYAPKTTAQIETARLIERYFGACLGGIFAREHRAQISRAGNYKRDRWWEKTGAKAYLVWNKGRVYELRLASPKLVRLECVGQAEGADYKSEGYGPCGERTVEILDNRSEILRLALGEVTGTTMTGQELQALLDQCLPRRPRPDLLEKLEGLVTSEGDEPAQRETIGQVQSLIDDCLRIRWWNIQEAYSQEMVYSFAFTGEVTTPAP